MGHEPLAEARSATVTFAELFEKHKQIHIPIIQRDFAQGRKGREEGEVRRQFLNSIYAALAKPENDPSLPLDLDFVYGSKRAGEGIEDSAFHPLDGQQRLTTLFLVHWYLAAKDRKSDTFRALVERDSCSRFKYEVRTSSSEFFDCLIKFTCDKKPEDTRSISKIIRDQHWFFRSWMLDPTIQACLVMMDAIEEKLGKSEGWYGRLVDADSPRITFQLLDLDGFGLSDELYIKMNARGKQLTPFENFKAALEKHLDTVFGSETKQHADGRTLTVGEYLGHQIDTEWADIFWHYRDKRSNLYDEKMMNLVHALVMVTRPVQDERSDGLLRSLKERSFSFAEYEQNDCLDRSMLECLISSLDYWVGAGESIETRLPDSGGIDEESLFRKIITGGGNLNYSDLVLFRAYTGFLYLHGADPDRDAFQEWMRVVSNLVANQYYDGANDFRRSIHSLNQLLSESHRVVEFFAADNKVRGFGEQQIREEVLKAQLMLKSTAWREAIVAAEHHGYFNGQIEFLFSFCGVLDEWLDERKCNWPDDADAAYLAKFNSYYQKACAVFGETGLRPVGESLWERALLSKGRYFLKRNSKEHLLQDQDRYASWKRLLQGSVVADAYFESRRTFVKQVLDEIDLEIGVKESLQRIVDESTPTVPWRRAFVKNPSVVEYCSRRRVQFESPDRIYLLKTTQMNGEHAELFTYDLYHAKIAAMDSAQLAPFERWGYVSCNDRYFEPDFRLCCSVFDHPIMLIVENHGDQWQFILTAYEHAIPEPVVDAVGSKCGYRQKSNGQLVKMVPRNEFDEAFGSLRLVISEYLERDDTGGYG